MIRPLPLAAGIALLAAAWAALLLSRDHPLFSIHMAAHMTVVAVAAPLLALGIAGSALDPLRLAPGGFSPLIASVLEFVVVWFWHMPRLHELAGRSWLALLAEQASFLMSGLLLWISFMGRGHTNRTGEGIIALLVTAMHMTLLGALIGLSRRPFYSHSDGAHPVSALSDQQLGGAIMLAVGGLSYLLGGLWLSWRLLRITASRKETP